jgi:ribosomal protein S18 acetylase RimI-like enzyme
MLDDWFKKKALKRHQRRQVRVTTAHLSGNAAPAGFSALGVCTHPIADLTDERDKVGWDAVMFPACYLHFVAVHRTLQGRGIGTELLLSAITATYEVSKHVGVHGLVLTSLNQNKVTFYQRLGFGIIGRESGSPTMLLPIDSIVELVEGETSTAETLIESPVSAAQRS